MERAGHLHAAGHHRRAAMRVEGKDWDASRPQNERSWENGHDQHRRDHPLAHAPARASDPAASPRQAGHDHAIDSCHAWPACKPNGLDMIISFTADSPVIITSRDADPMDQGDQSG